MKKININILFFVSFIIIWVSLVILNIAKPYKEFSEAENRYLEKFPVYSTEKLLNGEYLNKIDVFINDQFIARDLWISMKGKLEYIIGKRENNNIYIANGALMENLSVPNDKYVSSNIMGIEAFIDKFKKPVYFAIIPSAIGVQYDKLPDFAESWDQKAFIGSVYDKLKGKATTINIYDTLYEHKDEYIFYRTDHHYTSYGAYLTYKEIAGSLGLPVHPAEDYKITEISTDFWGTLNSRSGIDFVKPDTMESYSIGELDKFIIKKDNGQETYDSIYFDEYLSKKDKYSYFLGQNQPVVTIKTKSDSGKNLLIFKDSYSHCLAPMFMQEYSEITLVDLRYLNMAIEKAVKIDKYDQALFLFSMDTFSHNNDLIKLKLF
jgi:hypothetical protein